MHQGGGRIQERHMAYILAFKNGLDPNSPSVAIAKGLPIWLIGRQVSDLLHEFTEKMPLRAWVKLDQPDTVCMSAIGY